MTEAQHKALCIAMGDKLIMINDRLCRLTELDGAVCLDLLSANDACFEGLENFLENIAKNRNLIGSPISLLKDIHDRKAEKFKEIYPGLLEATKEKIAILEELDAERRQSPFPMIRETLDKKHTPIRKWLSEERRFLKSLKKWNRRNTDGRITIRYPHL